MRSFFLMVGIFGAVISNAQVITSADVKGRARDCFEKADRDIAYGKWQQGDSLLRQAVSEKPNFIDAWLMLGQLNADNIKDYKEAVTAFEKAKSIKADYSPDIDYHIGRCYIRLGNYVKAENHLKEYLKGDKLSAAPRMQAEKMLKDCSFAQDALKNPVAFKPVSLGKGVNTADEESMPTLTADGKYLYFTRQTGSGRYTDEDIYVSVNTEAGFLDATPVKTINTENFIEGAQSVSPSGKYLFFTSGDRPDGIGRADIYISRKTGDKWERPNNLGGPVNTPGWESQPCISADGRSLFFASVRASGKGGSDIWVSQLNENGTWSQPENLGSTINTMYDEMRPYIHPDGNTLYFTSSGHPGMGGFDVYVSYKQPNGLWGTPINLGSPINTPNDELGIFVTTDGKSAYYASSQDDSYGKLDIYKFEMPQAVRPSYTAYIKGYVYDTETNNPLGANVQVFDLESGKLFTSFSADKLNGTFLSTLPAGKAYACVVSRDGYLFSSENISLVDRNNARPYEFNIPLNKIKVGQSVVLNNVFFESDKFDLLPASIAELEVIVKLMENNQSLTIEISGHTDNTGSETTNLKLSEQRAKSVYNYLISKGVEAERLSFKGYASQKPVTSNATPEGRAKNRRTEFLVTGI